MTTAVSSLILSVFIFHFLLSLALNKQKQKKQKKIRMFLFPVLMQEEPYQHYLKRYQRCRSPVYIMYLLSSLVVSQLILIMHHWSLSTYS